MDTQHNEGETKFEQDFKELNVYLDVLCKNGHDVKDAGHTWIAFTDKFRNFKERILAAIPSTTPPPVRTAEEILIPVPGQEDGNFRDGKEIKTWMDGWEKGYIEGRTQPEEREERK